MPLHLFCSKVKFLLGILGLFVSVYTHAQKSENIQSLSMQVERTLKQSQQQNIISTIIKINNRSNRSFSGSVGIREVNGLRSIAGGILPIDIQPSDSIFLPVKFLIQPQIEAGTTHIQFDLLDNDRKLIDKQESTFTVEEKIALSLNVDHQNILITNPNDSVRVKANVINSGNKTQSITLVFSIPTLREGVNFIEQKVELLPMQQHQFSFSFMPSSSLLDKQNFSVNVTAMRGKDKEIFGSSSIEVQNVSTNRRFNETGNIDFNLFNPYQNNSITVNHRQTKSSSSITQLIGTGSIDLPAGYIGLSGNLYKISSDNTLVGTNTFLSYKLDHNEVTVGSVYESLETTLSGRGAKVQLGSTDNTNLRIGVIDQNYNIFSATPLFNNTYSIYAVGQLNSPNQSQRASSSFLYHYDYMEKSRNLITGGDVNWLVKNNWNINLRLHGAMSHIETFGNNKFSGSAELRYNGTKKGYDMSGSYYFSSNYFPGDRRGMITLQQMLYKKLNDKYSLRGSVFYSHFSPRSYTFTMNNNSQNLMGDVELYFPKKRNISTSVTYLSQYEQSNNYRQSYNFENANMFANRLKASIRWNNFKTKHSMLISVESGIAKYPSEKRQSMQLKGNLTYSYDWINFTTMYQYGSYYLSEYFLSQREEKTFRRLISSLAVNKDFSEKKYIINAGISITKDLYTDLSPSAFANFKYTPSKSYSVYINSIWNNYRFRNTPSNNSYSVEVGLTVNLQRNNASSKRKSKVSAFAFYDKNTNGVFDKGEEPAKNFNVKINNTAFITGDKGQVVYSRVPFGNYVIDQISENGWFSSSDTIKVTKFKTDVQIPLQQAGTVIGRIKYIFNAKSAIDVVPQKEGILFLITSSDGKTKQKVVTDNDGLFTAFLPTGDYQIELLTNSLPNDSFCKINYQKITVTSGKILNLKAFNIEIRQKKINLKHFSQ